jgi:thiol-disulfide isomerase/thioredoxin
MIHEVDYSLLSTLTTRHVLVMLYISNCQSCHLFESTIHPRLLEDLAEFDIAFYKSNCEKQTHIKHFPAFILHDRHTSAQVEYRGALRTADMGRFIRNQIMKCPEARIVPYKRYGGSSDAAPSAFPKQAGAPVELDVFSFDDLKERAHKTDKAFVVLYYADWCNQCTAFKPTFAQFAADNDGAIFGMFKDNGKYTAELFKTEGIVAVPTVKIYTNNQAFERKGAMSLEGLGEFVKSRTQTLQSANNNDHDGHDGRPSDDSPPSTGDPDEASSPWSNPNVRPITAQWRDEIQQMRDDGCVVLYYSPSCPFCEKIRPVFFQVADSESLQFAVVNVSTLGQEARAMLAEEDITAVPTIVMYTKYTSFLFDGEQDAQSIGRFIKHRIEQQQQTSNDRRSMLQIQGGGFLKQKSLHSQSLFLFPDNNGMHAKEHRARSHPS